MHPQNIISPLPNMLQGSISLDVVLQPVWPCLVKAQCGQEEGPPWELSALLLSSKVPARSQKQRDVTSCLMLVIH